MSAAEEPMTTPEELAAIARHPRMVGIGESGLDYHYTAESAAAQQESLRVHVEAARRTGLPLIIHARDADADMARILTEEHRAGPFSCVMHCFSSGRALAEAALDLGFYLSMSGIAAFPKSTALREIFAAAPLDRLLVETDAPYLAPPPHRGKRNEPAYTAHTARVGAELFGLDYADFAARTEANFERVFWKAAEPGAAREAKRA
jgi:TatD DNase family protein